jgi:phosphoribosylglycinamide formyltransferase-1
MSPPSPAPLQLAILISGRGSNMEAIAKACQEQRIHARVRLVIADRPDAAGLDVARALGLDAHAVPWQGATQREPFERALGEMLETCKPDLIVLAGFMRILSAAFVCRYTGKMLNIHPSLLPRHKGLHTHARVLESGERLHGASVHFVTAELDSGPVVLQSRLAVHPGDRERDLAARVLASEHVIYPKVIGWLADGRLQWRDGEVWLDGARLRSPVVEEHSARANR